MDITYLGHSAFRIRGKTVTVVTDPYASDVVGLKFPKHVEAQIVTVSHDHEDHNDVSAIEGSPFVVTGPGEYEIKGVSIVGVSTFHDGDKGKTRGKNSVYRIEIDGLTVVHLGDLGHMLETADIEALDGVDILLVPVGGVYTIDAHQAATLVHEIEPTIVIPMHYGRAGLNGKVFSELSSVSVFLKEIGKEDTVPQAKFTITKEKLPEEFQVVVLE